MRGAARGQTTSKQRSMPRCARSVCHGSRQCGSGVGLRARHVTLLALHAPALMKPDA